MTKFLKPVKTKFLMSSQPIPPAPTTNTLQVDTVVLSSSLRLTAIPRYMGGDYLKPHPSFCIDYYSHNMSQWEDEEIAWKDLTE